MWRCYRNKGTEISVSTVKQAAYGCDKAKTKVIHSTLRLCISEERKGGQEVILSDALRIWSQRGCLSQACLQNCGKMAKGPQSQCTGVTYLTPVYSRLSGEMSQILYRDCEKLVEGYPKYLKNHKLIEISSIFSYSVPQALFFGSFVSMVAPVETMTALGRGGVAFSEYRANTTEGNEAAVWPLIGTQSSGGAWLPGGGGMKRNWSTQVLICGERTV